MSRTHRCDHPSGASLSALPAQAGYENFPGTEWAATKKCSHELLLLLAMHLKGNRNTVRLIFCWLYHWTVTESIGFSRRLRLWSHEHGQILQCERGRYQAPLTFDLLQATEQRPPQALAFFDFAVTSGPNFSQCFADAAGPWILSHQLQRPYYRGVLSCYYVLNLLAGKN